MAPTASSASNSTVAAAMPAPARLVKLGLAATVLLTLGMALPLPGTAKEAAPAAETSWCVVKVAVLWDESTTRQLKLSICSNRFVNIFQFQDLSGI